MQRYFVYILTNKGRTVLYTGVTNNLERRLREHADDSLNGRQSFAGKYSCIYLLYLEEYQNIRHAIDREKEIKGWTRKKKIELIRKTNPEMEFLNRGNRG